MEQWNDGMHQRIADAIKTARGSRSAQWLADRTVDLGYPITRAQITNYENRRKQTLDIAELIVLAAALDMPPVLLIYPDPSDEPANTVDILPAVQATGFTATQWFSGDIWFSTTPGDGAAAMESRSRWRENTKALRGWRSLVDLRWVRSKHLLTNPEDTQTALVYESQIRAVESELGIADDA